MSEHASLDLGEGLRGLVRGEGEGVLWLHPYALDSSCFAELWDRLPGWRHVGVDLPGHGGSPLPKGELELDGLADQVNAVAEKHDVHHVVALALGTRVALQMAIQARVPYASLVLGSPLVEHGANDELFWKRYRELCSMQRIGGPGDHLRGRLMLVSPSPFEGARNDSVLWDRLWDIVGRHSFADLAESVLQGWGRFAQSEVHLHEITTPVLLVRGGGEGAAARKYGERLSRSLRDCRALHFMGSGTLSLLERPEQAASAIDSHLRAHAEAHAATGEGGRS